MAGRSSSILHVNDQQEVNNIIDGLICDSAVVPWSPADLQAKVGCHGNTTRAAPPPTSF